jgi:hypothetical protein
MNTLTSVAIDRYRQPFIPWASVKYRTLTPVEYFFFFFFSLERAVFFLEIKKILTAPYHPI